MDFMVGDNMNKNIPFSIEVPTDELMKPRAGNIDSISWGGRYGGSSNASYNMRLGIAWSSVAKSGYSAVTARLWVESAALQTYGVSKSYALTINGTSTSGNSTFNRGDWNSTFTHKLLEYTVNVTHTSAKSITISGSFDIEVEYAGVYVGRMTHSTTANLPSILTPPSAPTSITASGKYEVGEKINVSWSGATGTITEYEVQYIQYDYGNGAWAGWGNTAEKPGTGTSIQHAIASVGENRDRVRYRVRAKNAAGVSAWSPESNDVWHYGIKVNQSGFKWGQIHIWNGSIWCRGRVKIWNGSSWKAAK